MAYCNKCGAPTADDASFCIACGNALSPQAAPQQPAQPEATPVASQPAQPTPAPAMPAAVPPAPTPVAAQPQSAPAAAYQAPPAPVPPVPQPPYQQQPYQQPAYQQQSYQQQPYPQQPAMANNYPAYSGAPSKARPKTTLIILGIVAIVVVAAVLIGIFVVGNGKQKGDKFIEQVKTGHMSSYPSIGSTVGEWLETDFDNHEWGYYKSDSGSDIVTFSGTFFDEDSVPHQVLFEFLFFDDSSFDLYWLEVDDTVLTAGQIEDFLDYLYYTPV